MKATIAIDFDGVIHAYSKGWHDGSIYDDPVPGAVEAINYLLRRYAVFIHTSRDPAQVITWLKAHGFKTDTDNGAPTWNTEGVLLVTNRKLPAAVYIDDRALQFLNWQQALPELHERIPSYIHQERYDPAPTTQ